MAGLTTQQEKFAQAYIIYRNATEAAKAAGYSPRSAHNQGHRLIHNEAVLERIENLEREMETSVDVLSELEQQYTAAKNNNHTNSALKALELLSKVKKKDEEVEPKSVEELEQQIVKSLEVLGEERSLKIFMKCEWFVKMMEAEEEEEEYEEGEEEEYEYEEGEEYEYEEEESPEDVSDDPDLSPSSV